MQSCLDRAGFGTNPYTTVMSTAMPWYGSSANLIAIFGSIVVFLSALIGAWLTYWLTVPRRRLTYALVRAVPLPGADTINPDLIGPVDVARPRPLNHPWLLELQLRARGRSDIPSSAFDGGHALNLDLGVPLVHRSMKLSWEPRSIAAPSTRVDGTVLKIGPGLINRRHVLHCTVLAECPTPRHPQLACRSPLVDVTVRRDRRDQDYRSGLSQSTLIDWLGRIGFGLLAVNITSLLRLVVSNPVVLGAVTGIVAIIVTATVAVYVYRRGFST
jgi:hypothetical protein